MMALLGLPHAQRAAPALNTIESELAMLTATMVGTDLHAIDSVSDHGNDEEAQLRELTALAARIEMLALDNSYRFSASQAYQRLVQARIDELRESRIEGMPTVGEFMERRLVPAMNTCAAVASRQLALAQRIAQSNDLLRTRVGIVQEQQNRAILSSMNHRAAQQLHLQQAVEGLSEGRWSVLDYGGLIIHVFYDFVRQEYRLEDLWKKGRDMQLREVASQTAAHATK